MKNTKISYLYRDACNYKQLNEVVVEGAITQEQIGSIMGCLDGGEYFIPSQVGLPEMRFGEITTDDHCWFELSRDGFAHTDEEAYIEMSVQELVEAFLAALGKWDDSEMFG